MNQYQLNRQLVKAIINEDTDAIKKAIEEGADLKATDIFGETPLHNAVRYGYIQGAKLLLEAKADVNVQNNDVETPLGLDIRCGHTEAAALLRQHGGVE